MASAVIVAGLGVAALGFSARFVLKTIPAMSQTLAKTIPKIDGQVNQAFANSKYYKGGFDEKMGKREAALILGVRSNAPPVQINTAYKRMMRKNHTDGAGGSQYLSSKISEARDMLIPKV